MNSDRTSRSLNQFDKYPECFEQKIKIYLPFLLGPHFYTELNFCLIHSICRVFVFGGLNKIAFSSFTFLVYFRGGISKIKYCL